MKPSGQHDIFGKGTRLPCEIGENQLSHVLCQMCVAARSSQRGGINEIHMTGDQFAEGGIGTVSNVPAQELSVVEHRCSSNIQPPVDKSGQENRGVKCRQIFN